MQVGLHAYLLLITGNSASGTHAVVSGLAVDDDSAIVDEITVSVISGTPLLRCTADYITQRLRRHAYSAD